MPEPLRSRISHAWNALKGNSIEKVYTSDLGNGYSYRNDRDFYRFPGESPTITSIFNRIAIDVASMDIHHVRLDENGRYKENIDSGLEECLTVEANIDQPATAFKLDLAESLLDEGCVAIVPVETSKSPVNYNSFDIYNLRVGKITFWYPKHVRIKLYNERTGYQEEIILPKKSVAIVENPLYSIMNDHNSTLQRLSRKLMLLDKIDEQTGSSKLNMIVQLPYTVKSDTRKKQAEDRIKSIEMQLSSSKYGIAYADATEKITQLNRSLENNLLEQIKYYTDLLHTQLGITQEVITGTANEETMTNYYNRTVEPIVNAICEAMSRSFLTKTARTQGQSITYFRDPFKMVPLSVIADVADKFTRNEILSSNEIRSEIGYKPNDDPRSDQLQNKNLYTEDTTPVYPTSENQNGIENSESDDSLV